MMKAVDIAIPALCGFGLHLRLDGFRLIYVCIAVLMWGCSGVFSKEYMAHYKNKGRYYAFFWMTFAATVGVFLSEDLYTTFIFFEIMSLTSYVWVAFDEKKESLRAAETYLAVAVIGGLVMLMGLFMLYNTVGTLDIETLASASRAAFERGKGGEIFVSGLLMLFGFGAKAGMFPLHIWLPKAHPVAPAPASALLSGILTKTGIFGIIVVSCRMFANNEGWGMLILSLGLITMFLGALLAMFSVNLKRTLACSSVSQIGFILVGVGMCVLLSAAGENPSIAARGAFLHMINHSIFKLALFLCAGAVYMNLHELDLNKIRGFGKGKPLLAFAFLMGAVGLGGIPGFSGYISKTLLHESIVEYQHLAGGAPFWHFAEWVFLITGGMTVSYMLKLFTVLFIEEDPNLRAKFASLNGRYMTKASGGAILIPALMIPLMGVTPYLTMNRLADMGQGFFLAGGMEHNARYFTLENFKGGLISIAIGLLLYFFVIRKLMMKNGEYVDRWPRALDLEELIYRPLLQVALPAICGTVMGWIDRYFVPTLQTVFMSVSAVACRAMDQMTDGVILLARRTTHRQLVPKAPKREKDALERLMDSDPDGVAWESFSFGLMLFCLGLCFTLGYLIYSFFR